MDLILSTHEDLDVAHYKNSQKTINALEYLLFTKDLKVPRVKEVALRIAEKIEEDLMIIHKGYIELKADFLKDEKRANAIMLNALIENSYKLKEWRVGDPTGLSRKFKAKPNNKRAEYTISKNSILAIESILKMHLIVLDKQTFKNFGDMLHSYGADEELDKSILYLKDALRNSKNIKNDDFLNAKDLYKSLKKLHTAYYISMIGKLKITAKILDADGD